MEKYASFTINDSSQLDFIVIPSTLSKNSNQAQKDSSKDITKQGKPSSLG